MHELHTCRRGYLDFLPAREYLPMFWPEVLLQLLHGTSLPVERVAADAAAMQEDFAQVRPATTTPCAAVLYR